MTKTLAPFAKASNVRVRWIPEVSPQLRANYEKLLKDLNLLARARAEGVENRPATKSRDLDVAQREAIGAVEAGANMLRQLLDARLAEARDLIQVRTPKPFAKDAVVAEAAIALRRAELSDTESLVDLYKERQRALRQMNFFKRTNNLAREAMFEEDSLKSSTSLLWLFGGETIVNTGAFSLAGGGLASGVLSAGSFAVANLMLGLLTGVFGLRLLWHVRPLYRGLGAVFTAVGMTTGLWTNLVVANYREAVQVQADNELVEALRRSVSLGHLSELSATSICLLLLGLVFFVLALAKGAGGEKSFVDPYLKYRDFALPWRRTSRAYAEAKQASIARIKASIDVIEDQVRNRLADETAQVDEARDIAEQGVRRAGEISDSIVEYKDMGSTLLSAYRDENVAVRTAAAPAYFTSFPDLRAMVQGLPDGTDLQRLAETATATLNKNRQQAAELSLALAELHNERQQTFNTFIAEVESRGERELAAEAATTVPLHQPAPQSSAA